MEMTENTKGALKQLGYAMQSEYLGLAQRYNFICSRGHQFESFLDALVNRGHGKCKACLLEHKYEEVSQRLKDKGFELLSTTVSKITDKHIIRCPKGHIFKRRPDRIIYGRCGCPDCYSSTKLGSMDKIAAFIESRGFTCDDLENYKNEESILTYTCKQGHATQKSFSLFKDANTCIVCAQRLEAIWVTNVKKLFPKCKIVKKLNSSVLEMECGKCGNTDTYSISTIAKRGICCYRHQQPIDLLALYSYTLIDAPAAPQLRASRRPAIVECGKGHRFTTQPRFLMEGHGCASCASQNLNAPERELGAYLESLGLAVKYRDRTMLPNHQELDLLIADRKLAIEYRSVFWHSYERLKKIKPDKIDRLEFRAQDKAILAAERGIRLLTIIESDYVHNRQAVLDNIKIALEDGIVGDGLDVCWNSPISHITLPKARYYDCFAHEVEHGDPSKRYTVYDCGYNVGGIT